MASIGCSAASLWNTSQKDHSKKMMHMTGGYGIQHAER